MPQSNRALILVPLSLIALVFITFAPTLRNHFVNWDDQNEVYENPDFNPVTIKGLAWNWEHTRLSLYMPVTYMAWGAVAAVSPRDAGGVLLAWPFHLLNIILHAVCTLLVFLLLRRLRFAVVPAALGAAFFAVHPIQVEAVAWVSGMYTLLSTALSLAAMLLYLESTNQRITEPLPTEPGRAMAASNVPQSGKAAVRNEAAIPRRLLYMGAILLFVVALLTKAAAAALPLVILPVDLLIMGRKPKTVARSLMPWFILAIPFIFLAKHFQDVSSIPTPPIWARPIVALDAIGFYMAKIAWPIGLSPDYGRNPRWLLAQPSAAWITGMATVTVIAIAISLFRRTRWPLAAMGVFIAAVSPYLGLTTFDFQYVSTVADRYAYQGVVGVAMLVAAMLAGTRRWLIPIILIVVCCMVRDYQQEARWHDTDRLFQYTLATHPRSLVAHAVLGFVARHEGKLSLAEYHYLRALEIWPEDAVIHYNLGNLYLDTRVEEAIRQYQDATRFQPGNGMYHNALGVAYEKSDRPREAFEEYRLAIILAPEYAEPHIHIAYLLLATNRVEPAVTELQTALRLDPNNRHARELLEWARSNANKPAGSK